MREKHTQIQPASAEAVACKPNAAYIRGEARRVMDVPCGTNHRFTLILAVILFMTIAVGFIGVWSGFMTAVSLLVGNQAWLVPVGYGLLALLGVFLVLPLAASLFRLACLMTWRTIGYGRESVPASDGGPTLIELFYPFASRAAYGRCMAVGLEALGWAALWGILPAIAYVNLAGLFDKMATRGVLDSFCTLMTFAALLICIGWGVLMLFLSGRRAGFGYFAFVHEDAPLREVNRYFKSLRRSFGRPFALRFSFAGWIALSFVAILIPFVVHTIPYGLCCGAVYGEMLNAEGGSQSES
jgi:hypothetical protein